MTMLMMAQEKTQQKGLDGPRYLYLHALHFGLSVTLCLSRGSIGSTLYRCIVPRQKPSRHVRKIRSSFKYGSAVQCGERFPTGAPYCGFWVRRAMAMVWLMMMAQEHNQLEGSDGATHLHLQARLVGVDLILCLSRGSTPKDLRIYTLNTTNTIWTAFSCGWQ